MRVTNSLVFKNFLFQMRRARGKLEDLQIQTSSGKRLNRPSDDPADTQAALRLRHSLTQLDQYERNINRGQAMLSVAETALTDVGEILQTLKARAVEGANGTLNLSNRIAIAEEVTSLRDRLIQLANTEFDGQFLFSGTKTNTPAYSGTGTYDGNSGTIQVTISRNTRVAVTKPGNAIFGTAGGGVDIFAAINNLDTALRSNDVATVQSQIDVLESGRAQVVAARAELGAKANRLDGSKVNIDNLSLALTDRLSIVEDADLVETITALQSQQNVLNATLASFSTLSRTSLLDFLQ